MFTIEAIKAAHSKVRSGADFPQYIRDLKQLGVNGYETYVNDGHALYFGQIGYTITSDAKYPELIVVDKSDMQTFTTGLKEHQQGQSDYITFCKIAAATGVEKWVTDIELMTCTYFDKAGAKMLVEPIPQ